MRRARGSVRSVERGVWRVQASLGRDPMSGKRVRLSRTVHGTKAEAERELVAMHAATGSAPDARSLTLRDYVDDVWIPSLEPPNVRARTRDGYESKMALYVVPYLGHLPLADLDPFAVDRWISALRADGYSDATVYHAFAVLRCALKRAVKWRLLCTAPTDAVDTPKVSRSAPEVLTESQANALLDAVYGTSIETAVMLALGAGLRRSEICALQWSDVDLKAGTVSIRGGLHRSKGKSITEPPKTPRSRRTVTLPDWTITALRRHRGIGPVLGVTADSLAWRYRQVTKDMPARVPFKNLRHTHATIALAHDVDVVTVSRRLGHSTVLTTDRFYLAPGRSADQGAADAMSGMRSTRRKGRKSS